MNRRSTVAERLSKKNDNHDNKCPVAYFYCYRNEETRRDPSLILGAILKQLVLFSHELPTIIISAYDNRYSVGSTRPLDLSESQDLIVKLASMHTQTVLIIDALDEIDMVERQELLDALDFIVSNSGEVVRIFLSSRDDGDIVHKLSGVPNLSIRARDNNADIERFITREVEYLVSKKRLLGGNVPDELRQKIECALGEKACGM